MTYSAVRSAILAHCATAATAVDASWIDVAVGAGGPGAQRCVRLAWSGQSGPERMGASRTLGSDLVSETLAVSAFWPLSIRDTTLMALVDAEMQQFGSALRAALLGDSQLGGACADISVGYAQPSVVEIGNSRWAVVSLEVAAEYDEYTLGA